MTKPINFCDDSYTFVYWLSAPLKRREDCRNATSALISTFAHDFPEIEALPGAAISSETHVPIITMSDSKIGVTITLSRARVEIRQDSGINLELEIESFLNKAVEICELLASRGSRFQFNRQAFLRNRIATESRNAAEIASRFTKPENELLTGIVPESFLIGIHRQSTLAGLKDVNIWIRCNTAFRREDDSPTVVIEHDINTPDCDTTFSIESIREFGKEAIKTTESDLLKLF